MYQKDQRSILITGCSSGIGLSTATSLKEMGWNVIASCRKETDCKILQQEHDLITTVIDYDDEKSILNGLDFTLQKTNGKIDVLFNNGAYGLPSLFFYLFRLVIYLDRITI